MASERGKRRIERLLDEADEAVSRLDWETVRDRAQAALVFDPENSEALELLSGAERALTASDTAPRAEPASSPPIATPTQPTSFANGRYQFKRFLGEGGKKKVYLAHDTTLDREVAFALIKTDGLDETSRTRIQREAQAMGRLGSHSHIVTVFDLGEEQDQPYMVTELMGGGDVEGLVENAPEHRLPLEQAIKIAQETCRGMEFAHSRGIVHRDLKPGNVWLTEDGIAKIGDFGLAVALDRSRLTTEGMMVGTVSYMPPEQAMGGEVTPRSDLYSLGAMLYEMVTGRPPFLGDDSVAIIGQHINTPPVAPTWHNGQCPRALDALILRLLAKDPSERPDSATDVLSALDAIYITEAPPLVKGEGGISDTHALDSLAGGVFVGRQKEMGDLKACLEDALSGRGRLVTLVGEPGIGKSRTAQELTTYAGLRSAQLLWGRSYEEQGVPPYWPWVQAIRSYVRERDPEQLQSEMGSGAADIAEVVSDVRERLPALPQATQLEPEQARFRLFDSIAAFLKTASQRQPLVLVLDDLHWADQLSLALLQFVARELGGARLLIIGTYRDMELSRQHPLAEALGELTRERLFQRVLLRRLNQEDVGRFIEMTSGHTAPRGLVEAVHTQTEGNPLFVTEVVRLLVQEGELGSEQVRETDSWTIRIPEGVREVIGRRLNRLSQRCNEALTVASVVGREFTLAQLKPLIDEVSEDRLFDILEEALAARVVEEMPQTVGRYQFNHALIQETLSGELSTTRRVRLHSRIAQALEELYGDDADAHAAELAHHYSEAEAMDGSEKLVRYSLVAGERALTSYAWEEALAHLDRALAAKEGEAGSQPSERANDEETAAILMALGYAQAALNQLDHALSSFHRAFDFYASTSNGPKAVEIAAYGHSGELISGMSDLMPLALELVDPDSHDAGRILANYGHALGQTTEGYQEAMATLERALVISRRESDKVLEVRTQANMANIYGTHLRWAECLDAGLRTIELNTTVDDPQSEMRARLWAAGALMQTGETEQVSYQGEQILEVAERLHDHPWILRGSLPLMQVAFARGDWDSARQICDRFPDRLPIAFTALIDWQLGDYSASDVNRLLRDLSIDVFGGISTMIHLMLAVGARIGGDSDLLDLVEANAVNTLNLGTLPIRVSVANSCLAVVAVERRNGASAELLYRAITSGHYQTSILCTSRVLGLLSQTMGNLGQAAEHFEGALDFCRKAGFRPELAWTCCDYADALLQRDGEGDRAKAMSLLDESLASSSELGMRPLMERVLSRREILKA